MLSLPYRFAIAVGFTVMVFAYGVYTGKGICETKEIKQTVKTVERVRYVKQKSVSYPDPVLDERVQRWER